MVAYVARVGPAAPAASAPPEMARPFLPTKNFDTSKSFYGRLASRSCLTLSQAFFRISKSDPCPALLWTYCGSRCGLVQEPAMFAPVRTRIHGETRMRNAAMRILGSGKGCDARYTDEDENKGFQARVRDQRKSLRKLLEGDQAVWGVKLKLSGNVDGDQSLLRAFRRRGSATPASRCR
jgi:hypothetical protein